MYQLHNFNKQQFLDEFWQKKPLIMKQGFQHFIDPIDENELAGLSEENGVDSRIISCDNSHWQVSHGPFDDINQQCKGAWSLLVQSVDHYSPEADQLMNAFNFIPHWRMDDLMVSYSNEQAGVGPHLDQYDVFIIQGKGSRRWQVGLPGDFKTINPHADLSQITDFEPVIDQVLHPGDIVYIPANHPHNGVALEDCLNYSVGFRAPSQQELLSSFADFCLDKNLFANRYKDQQLSVRHFSGEIKQQEVAIFKQLFSEMLDSEQFSQWLPNFLSQNKVLTQIEIQENPYNHEEIVESLQQGLTFVRAPGVKPNYIEQSTEEHADFIFYIEGERFLVPKAYKEMVTNFLFQPQITDNSEINYHNCLFFSQLLTKLINSGYWYLEY